MNKTKHEYKRERNNKIEKNALGTLCDWFSAKIRILPSIDVNKIWWKKFRFFLYSALFIPFVGSFCNGKREQQKREMFLLWKENGRNAKHQFYNTKHNNKKIKIYFSIHFQFSLWYKILLLTNIKWNSNENIKMQVWTFFCYYLLSFYFRTQTLFFRSFFISFNERKATCRQLKLKPTHYQLNPTSPHIITLIFGFNWYFDCIYSSINFFCYFLFQIEASWEAYLHVELIMTWRNTKNKGKDSICSKLSWFL